MKNKEIYFAGGCFWGLEGFLAQAQGVLAHEVGYVNGDRLNPCYREVCSGSGHAEAVRILYDPEKISTEGLIRLFFTAIDPFSVNRQGNDRGIQYRSGIYLQEKQDLEEVQRVVATIQTELGKPIAVETGLVKNYTLAEEEHQDYLVKNPGGYCHISPAYFMRAKKFEDPLLK